MNTTNSYTFTGGPISGGGLSIDGGTLVLQNATAWSGSSQISSGALLIQNGASFTNLSNMGSLAVQGVTISATTLNNSGRICLTDPPGGNAFGQLLVGGNFTQSSTGELDIALGGLTAGSQYGLLNITDIATLAGTLDVSLADGFTPVPGDIFDIIDAGSMEPSRPSITQSEMVFSTFPTPPPGFS